MCRDTPPARTARLWLFCLLPFLGGFDVLSRPNPAVSAGNSALASGQAEAALAHYDRALTEGLGDPGVELNRGLALSALGRHDEATQAFLQATRARDTTTRAQAFYNLGNSFSRGEKWSEAIEAYKRALMLNSKNRDAKWNLELALRKKRDQENKDENKDENKNESQNKDKQDPSSKGSDKQQQQEDQQKNGNGPKPPEPKANEPPKPEQEPKREQEPPPPKGAGDQNQDEVKNELNPEGRPPTLQEFEAILDSLEKSPKDLERARALQRAVRRRPPAKDW